MHPTSRAPSQLSTGSSSGEVSSSWDPDPAPRVSGEGVAELERKLDLARLHRAVGASVQEARTEAELLDGVVRHKGLWTGWPAAHASLRSDELGRGVVRRAIERGDPARSDDLFEERGFPLGIGEAGEVRAVLAVPLALRGEHPGVER